MVEKMADKGLAKHFHFTGFLQGSQVEKMYALSDLYVMPSVSEPFGIAPLEAMVYNTPVIISKQSGVAEVLPHAIKVDFWDVDKLAEGIISVLQDDELATTMTSQNAEYLKNIRWEQAAKKVAQLYQTVSDRERNH